MQTVANAQAEYAAISRKLKSPNLTGKERGILNAQRNKAKVRLRDAYAEAAPVAVVAPIESPKGIESNAPSKPSECVRCHPRHAKRSSLRLLPVPFVSRDAPPMRIRLRSVDEPRAKTTQTGSRCTRTPELSTDGGSRLSNLVNALTMKNTAGVYVTRRKKILARPKPRYRPEDFNEKFLLILDGLITMGIVGQRLGEWHGDRTALTPGRRLVDLVRRFGTRHREDVIANRARQEVLLLKAPQYWDADETSLQPIGFDPGELAEYDDTELTVAIGRKSNRSTHTWKG